jgi:hypothetical protein
LARELAVLLLLLFVMLLLLLLLPLLVREGGCDVFLGGFKAKMMRWNDGRTNARARDAAAAAWRARALAFSNPWLARAALRTRRSCRTLILLPQARQHLEHALVAGGRRHRALRRNRRGEVEEEDALSLSFRRARARAA